MPSRKLSLLFSITISFSLNRGDVAVNNNGRTEVDVVSIQLVIASCVSMTEASCTHRTVHGIAERCLLQL